MHSHKLSLPQWSTLRQRTRNLAIPLLAASMAFIATSTHAATVTVPGQFPTIQAAINAANSGDTIDVAPGTYRAVGDFNLTFGTKNLTLESTEGAAATILDNSGGDTNNQKRTISLNDPSNTGSVLKGFTIKNSFFDLGGAVLVSNSTVTITQCVFINNNAPSSGGAIAIESSNAASGATISQCSFFGNTTGDATSLSGFGGAIECYVPSSGAQNVTITDCVFDSNTAIYDGGAIDLSGPDSTSTTPIDAP